MNAARDGGKAMKAVIFQGPEIWVPGWVVDLDSFHRWVDSDDVPEHVRIDYLQGEVWIDVSEQQIFTRLRVKTEFTRVMANLAIELKRGFWLTDGLRVTHPATNLSAIPDGTFILNKSLQSGRVRMIEGAEAGYVRIEGSPDVVLEVVSTSSVHKDVVQLRSDYWEAGIREYWLVDARCEPLTFEILRYTAKGYVAAPERAGWIKSAVLRKAFQLTQRADILGHPLYTLSVR
jgi:Uma2 family endonuclease